MISPDAGTFDEEFDWASIPENQWEMLTAIILDTRTPLERMKTVVQQLKAWKYLDYRRMKQLNITERVNVLKNSGYPWYNQKSKFFDYTFTKNPQDMSYKEL